MTFDVDDLLGSEVGADAVARVREAIHPSREVAGWATVELDRAEASFGVLPGASASGLLFGSDEQHEDGRDELLGATARVIRAADDREIALLEPFTEGRLAAALARNGEGFVALYLMTNSEALVRAKAAGFVLSATGQGPFGTQRLVVAGPRWGPFIVLAGLD